MSAKLPESLEELGKDAFAECSSLQIINLPKGLKKIGNGALRGCKSLAEPLIIGTTLVLVPAATEGEYTIPENVTAIAGGAFTDCEKITDVVFPEGLKVIGSRSFIGCNGLERLDLPKTLEKVADEAFLNCTGLKFVIVRGNTEVADEAFSGCYNLTSIVHNN